MRWCLLESGDEGEYIIGLFSNEVEVSITNVQLDWFKFGELEDKEGKFCLTLKVHLREMTSWESACSCS